MPEGIRRIIRVISWVGLLLAFIVGGIVGIETELIMVLVIWPTLGPIAFFGPWVIGKTIYYIIDGFKADKEAKLKE